jgi:hypothetical protein
MGVMVGYPHSFSGIKFDTMFVSFVIWCDGCWQRILEVST